MKFLFRLLGNALLGLALLFLVNIAGGYIGLSAGITAAGVGTVALLGLPGFALVLILQTLV